MPERLKITGFAVLMAVMILPAISSAQTEDAQNDGNAPLPRLPLPIAPGNYPVESIIANEEGSVVLRANIGTDGQMSGAQVTISSGYERLDAASIFLTNDARLPTPPTNAAGELVSVDVLVDMNWELPLETADEYLIKPDLPPGVTPPEPDGTSAASVRARDYPSSAIRRGVHGTVAMNILVSEEGEADGVEITHPSGERDIDRAAETLSQRFRWIPANQNGAITAWQIPYVIHFVAIPGRASGRCHTVPLVADTDSTVNITGSLTRGGRVGGSSNHCQPMDSCKRTGPCRHCASPNQRWLAKTVR